jgi:hypothetical protein
MIRKLGIFVTYLFMASSCLEEPECLNLNNHIIGITFKNKSDGKAAVVTFTNIKALGSDSVFVATGNKVVAPLNYFKQETTYVFTQADVVDTLQLSYKAQPQFVSVDCGERYVLSELEIVSHTFDSVRVLSRVPSNQTTANNIDIFN